MLHDIRDALRSLRRQPGFTAVATLTLALGIAANTAVFTVVNAVLVRPLPYAKAHQLVAVWPEVRVSKKEFVERRQWFRAYQGLDLWSRWGFTLTGSGEPEELDGVRATVGLFATLGVVPALGRTFERGEDQPGRDRVVVLSNGLWQRRFGGDSSIVGRTIVLGGIVHTVIGVMPREFSFPSRDRELYTPVVIDPSDENDYPAHYLGLVGRLHQGWTTAQAEAELRSVIDRIRETSAVPDDFGRVATVVPLRHALAGGVRGSLFIIWGAVGLVLVLACANVANLMLVRGTIRERDLAVRAAIGAGRARVMRYLLVESFILAALGGVVGGVFALWVLELLVSLMPMDILILGDIRVDPVVFAFVALMTTFCAVGFGSIPALRLSGAEPQAVLREGSGSTLGKRRLRVQHALVVGEVAIAVMLLVGAGLMAKSFWLLQRVDPGFTSDHALMLRLAPPAAKYRSGESRRQYYSEVLARLISLTGVQAAGGIVTPPLGASNYSHRLEIDGHSVPENERSNVNWRAVTPDYFRAMGIGVVRGRPFDARDAATAPRVALINRTFAEAFWPDGNALGQRVRTGFDGSDWVTVVGIVDDVHQQSLEEPVAPELYRPFDQWPWFNLTLVLRTTGDPLNLAAQARREVWTIDRDVPISDVRTLEDAVAQSVARPRFYTALLTALATLGLTLGAVGLFGVLSFAVSRRTREIGLRMALGAGQTHVLGLVLRRGLMLTLGGITLGLVAAYTGTRLMTGMLFGVTATDPATFATVSVVLGLVALLAAFVPARRATRVDPIEALRYE